MPIPTDIYDPIPIPAPLSGMNMNLDEEALPSSYAASLVNFIPDPMGSITLRNGTEMVEKSLAKRKVLNAIPYVKKDGTEDFLKVCLSLDETKQELYLRNNLIFEFSLECKMRGFQCMGKLLLCNGLDPVQVFDEDAGTIAPLEQRIELQLKNPVNGFFEIIANFQGCHLNKYVRVVKDDVDYSVTETSPTKFKLVDSDGGSPVQGGRATFIVRPPRTSFCSAFGDRLWFLGEGAISTGFKEKDQSMLANYSYSLHRIDDFLDPHTGLIPFLSLSGVSSRDDSLDRMEQYLNYLVFFGKKEIYFYNGLYVDAPDFKFSHAIPVGLYHSDLVQKIGNDIIFVSYGSVKKISTLKYDKQTEISDVNGLDPFIIDAQSSMDPKNYLYCSSAFYDHKKQLMFKIGRVETAVFSVFNETYIPYLYSGDFLYSYSLSEGRNGVYLAYRDCVLGYQEERENIHDVLSGSLSFIWKSPTFSLNGKTFSSQKVMINADADPEFTQGLGGNKSDLQLEISGVSNRNFAFSKQLKLQSSGDFISGFDVRRTNNYGVLPSVEFKQSLKISFTKANAILFGESAVGRLKMKKILLLGVFSHG